MGLVLRDYQEECVSAHYTWFFNNNKGHPLFVVPTAGGKSLIIAEFIRRSLRAWPKTRVLVITHVKELIAQNYAEFVHHWGDEGLFHPAGIYSAGMKRRDTNDQVVFAGIQSIYNKPDLLGWFDLVLIDECHLVPKKGEGRYRTYLEALEKRNPNVKVCGYTATHYRLEGGYLHEGAGRIYTDIAYDVGVSRLIKEGWLAPLVAKKVEHAIDTTGIHTVRGDFKASELEEAAIAVVSAAVAETVKIAREDNRKHWLFFASGVEHAKMICSELNYHGVDVKAVFGSTTSQVRDNIIHDFRSGKLQALVNVGVLTTGFNAPCCDMMAVMRPTQSTSLYVQIMGRGMRLFPGKKNCLVLDYGENVQRHGPINKVKPKKKGEGVPPVRVCPECNSIVSLGINLCPECGYIWPWKPPVRKQTERASDMDPFDPDADKPRVMAVKSMHFRIHEKEGRPDSMRVDFQCGMRIISEWVCIEHHGFAGRKACRWWATYGGSAPIPTTVDEAIDRQNELRVPQAIEVIDDGKYERVARPLFEPQQQT